MLGSGNNLSSSSSGISLSEMPPLPQCLALDPITLGNQKYTRSGELRRVLGVPLGSTSEDHSFGASQSKLMAPVASGELKHFRERVQDASKKARDRAELFRDSISKLEKYREVLNSKKRQRTSSPSDRGGGATLTKMGSQIHRSPNDAVIQRSEGKSTNSMTNKRIRTSGTDIRVESKSASSMRQQIVIEKDGNLTQTAGGGSLRIEEKTRRLLAGGEGLDQKIKKKRSVGAVGNKVINGERDMKRATLPKTSADLKLRYSDSQGFRLKSISAAGGINKSEGSSEPNSGARAILGGEQGVPLSSSEPKVLAKGNNRLNTQEDCSASSPNTVIKNKGSRAPRTGSVTALESFNVQPSSGTFPGSSIHPMTQWVGQRPHKNSRSRRANVIPPVSRNVEAQVSSEGCPASDFCGGAYSVGFNGSQLTGNIDNNTQKNSRTPDDISSPFGLSESEESGAGESKVKDKAMCSRDFSLNAEKAGVSKLQMRKNKISTDKSGDFLQRQGRTGRSLSLIRPGLPSVREKSENLSVTKPAQHMRPNDRSKTKHGRPPSKKQKDRKVLTHVGKTLNNGSSDFVGESDDDHEELYQAANSARKASKLACSSLFWKKMEPIFGSVSLENVSYLKQQLTLAEELDESLSQVFGIDHDILAVLINEEATHGSGETERSLCNQESIKTHALCGKNLEREDKVNPLFQRVLSALIEEDDSEDSYHHSEAKIMSRQCTSEDSHCGSCDQIDFEPKDRDKMDSEVESMVDHQIQMNHMLDRPSCDKSAASNSFRHLNTSNSLQSTGVWQGDEEFLHSDITRMSDACSNDLGQLQIAELRIPGCPSDAPYQLLCLDDKILIELQSIGLYPEILPDLAEEDEAINQEITELKKHLHQQIGRKKKNLVRVDRGIQKERDTERRKNEQVAFDQLVEMAYRKRLACRGSKNSKSALQKVSKQASLAFVRRTLGRCKQYEETGNSCFSESSLQSIMFSLPSGNDEKSADGIVSGTASNTYNKASNQVEAKKSGVVSSASEKNDSHSDNVEQGFPDSSQCLTHTAEQLSSKKGSVIFKEKKREVLVNGVLGSSYSRSSNLDGTSHGGVKGKRSERERNQSRQNSTSRGGCLSLDGSQNELKTKAKPKQKSSNVGHHGSNQSVVNAGNRTSKGGAGAILPGDQDASAKFGNSQLHDLDSMEDLSVSGELGGPQDITSWLNIDDDALPDDLIGLEIPMDDISELNMF